MFLRLLYATKGGYGNISSIWGSCIILRQCFLVMAETEGSRGSQETTQTGLLLMVVFLATFLIATNLGIFLAFDIAELIIPSGLFLSRSMSFNSLYLFSLVSISEQILVILIAKERGMFSILEYG